jgi:hypothetical protein
MLNKVIACASSIACASVVASAPSQAMDVSLKREIPGVIEKNGALYGVRIFDGALTIRGGPHVAIDSTEFRETENSQIVTIKYMLFEKIPQGSGEIEWGTIFCNFQIGRFADGLSESYLAVKELELSSEADNFIRSFEPSYINIFPPFRKKNYVGIVGTFTTDEKRTSKPDGYYKSYWSYYSDVFNYKGRGHMAIRRCSSLEEARQGTVYAQEILGWEINHDQ